MAADFDVLIAWRERVTKAIEPFRAAKGEDGKPLHGKSVDAAITLRPPAADRAVLERYLPELAELFIVSAVNLGPEGGDEVTVTEHTGPRCERCWKHFDTLADDPNDVCRRCADALRALKARTR